MPELEKRHDIRFTSLIDHTLKHVAEEGLSHVGILASPTTIRTRLYESELQTMGVETVLPSPDEIKIIEACIRGAISGEELSELRQKLEEVICAMQKRHAQKILLGCTELSVIFSQASSKRLIDPLGIVTIALLD